MKHIKSIIKAALIIATQPLLFASCSDNWNDHYDTTAQGTGTESLSQLIAANPELSDFYKVCQSTHLYNNMRQTKVTYADLLASDQSLTVWAPVNGSFNVDSMLTLCQTAQGDSTIGQHFVANHISRSLYNMNSSTDESVKMLNDKFLTLSPSRLYTSQVITGSYNLPATNGLLHIVSDDAPYTYNIYEGLTSLSRYSHIGSFLKQFEQQELDEDRSIQSGLVDGRKVYSDSVMVTENVLFRTFGDIISEDSTFIMMVPSADVWAPVYEEATKYFNFGSVEKADSIEAYWKNVSLVQDLIFNSNKAVNHSLQDSIISTSFSARQFPYHVYYKPFDADSLFDRAMIVDSLQCSNGWIYNISQWPFDTKQLYFHPIKMEGEREANMTDNTLCTTNIREVNNESVSGKGYIDIVPKTSTSNWTATFEVTNTLSGTYDICIITLPKTIYLANSKDKKPNKFKASLKYTDLEGNIQTQNFDDELITSGTDIDTMVIGRHTFPVCNYMQPDATVSLTIQCSITNRQTQYSREMFLDCVYLRPVTDDDIAAEESKQRKEASK